MSYKRSHDDLEYEPTVPKRKLDEISLLSQSESQSIQSQTTPQNQSQTQSLIQTKIPNNKEESEDSKMCNISAHDSGESMDCEPQQLSSNSSTNVSQNGAKCESIVESDDDDDYDTDPDIIIPYLNRFQESYQSSLSIYSSRLEKLELSDALKCTNDLFAVAIDNYMKEHNGFAHKTQMDLSGVQNVRREFDQLLIGSLNSHKFNANSEKSDTTSKSSFDGLSFDYSSYSYIFDDKLAKVISFMCRIESKICSDMKSIYESYEKLLSDLILIEYRLAIIIEMFHHMTDIEPQKFLPSLPFIQNVPDLIGYINSLYDEENELPIKDESSNERMQAIVNQFRAMHKRIRDAMDGLHALSCIIMEKKTEVIDRVHTFYKKAEQIFFSEPSYMFQTKDNTSRCL